METDTFFFAILMAILGAFYAAFIFTKYKSPPSFRASIRRISEVFAIMLAVHLGYGYFRNGAFDLESIVVIAFACMVMLAVDWIVLRKQRQRTAL